MPRHYFKERIPEEYTEQVGSELLKEETNKFMSSENKKYSVLKGLGKAVVNTILFAVPVIVASNPAWLDLTIGGALVMGANYLKIKFKGL